MQRNFYALLYAFKILILYCRYPNCSNKMGSPVKYKYKDIMYIKKEDFGVKWWKTLAVVSIVFSTFLWLTIALEFFSTGKIGLTSDQT